MGGSTRHGLFLDQLGYQVMRYAWILTIAVVINCGTKPKEPTSGSAGLTGSGAPSQNGDAQTAAPAAGSTDGRGSGTPGAIVTTSGGPPKRSSEDAARFTSAERAFDAAIAKAKGAASVKDTCAAIEPLVSDLGGLDHITPPPGSEQAFAEARNSLGMKIDYVKSNACADASASPTDIASDLATAREALIALEAVGAKP